MGKWQRTPAIAKKRSGPSGIGFSPQKRSGGGAKVICCQFSDVANVFSDRGGRGILQDADPSAKLFAFFFVPGETQPLLYKFTECLRQFMEEQGDNLDNFCEANSMKLVTSNGWDPMRLGMVNFSRAAYIAIPEGEMAAKVKNMILFFDDFLRWRFSKVTAKVKLVEWIVPSNLVMSLEELECPGVSLTRGDDAVKSALLQNLHGFEGPSGPKHVVLVVEFVQEQVALTLHGDGYPHRSLLQPFQQVRDRSDGSKEYSYSTGLIDYSEAIGHEIVGSAIHHRYVLVKPVLTVEEMPSVAAVKCWNLLCELPNLLGEGISLAQVQTRWPDATADEALGGTVETVVEAEMTLAGPAGGSEAEMVPAGAVGGPEAMMAPAAGPLGSEAVIAPAAGPLGGREAEMVPAGAAGGREAMMAPAVGPLGDEAVLAPAAGRLGGREAEMVPGGAVGGREAMTAPAVGPFGREAEIAPAAGPLGGREALTAPAVAPLGREAVMVPAGSLGGREAVTAPAGPVGGSEAVMAPGGAVGGREAMMAPAAGPLGGREAVTVPGSAGPVGGSEVSIAEEPRANKRRKLKAAEVVSSDED